MSYLCAARAVQSLATLLAPEATLVPFLAVGTERSLGKVDSLVTPWTLGHFFLKQVRVGRVRTSERERKKQIQKLFESSGFPLSNNMAQAPDCVYFLRGNCTKVLH